jgi:hypothetical protein
MEQKNQWNGTIEELKAKVDNSVNAEDISEYQKLSTNQDSPHILSCETEIIGTCVRDGKTGRKTKYTCTDSSGNKYSFNVCDIS